MRRAAVDRPLRPLSREQAVDEARGERVAAADPVEALAADPAYVARRRQSWVEREAQVDDGYEGRAERHETVYFGVRR